MKMRFNVRFLLYLFGSLAVLGTATHFIHGFQVRRNAVAFLTQATEAQERGKLTEAAELYERYLGLVPNDTDALAKFGELLADEKFAKSLMAKQRAWLVLNKVLYRDPNLVPNRDRIRRTVVKLAIDLGRYTDAKNDLLSDPPSSLLKLYPEDGELNLLLARCYEKTSQYKVARNYYNLAIKYAPNNLDSYQRLAQLLRQRTEDVRKDPAKDVRKYRENRAEVISDADETIDEMVAANDKSFQAYLGRANYLRATRSLKEDPEARETVEQDIAQAQSLAPDEVDVILAVADLARDRGEIDEARALLNHGCEIHETEWRMYKALGQLEASNGEVETGIACLRRGLKQVPGLADLLWDLAELQIAGPQKSEAEETIRQLGKSGLPAAYCDYLTAKLEIANEHWREASQVFEKAIPSLVDIDARMNDGFSAQLAQQAGLMLARCYEQQGDSEPALAAYSRVVTRDARSVLGLYGMGRASLSLGRYQEALDQFQQMMRLTDSPIGLIEIARAKLLQNLQRPLEERSQHWSGVDQAVKAADDAARLRPPLPVPPLPVEVVILDVESKAAQEHYDEASARILKEYPNPKTRPAVAWGLLATLELRQSQQQAATLEQRQRHQAAGMALLDEAEAQIGDQVDLRLARARFLSDRKLTDAQAAIAKLADKREQFKSEDQQRLLRGLASVSLQAGDLTGALRLWEQLAILRPDDASLRLTGFDIATQAGETKEMENWQLKIQPTKPDDGVLWRYAQARYLIELARHDDKKKDGLAEARAMITAVKARRPDWSRIVFCEALVDDIGGRPDLALGNYQRAIGLGPVEPLATLRAAELLYFKGRYEEANKLFVRIPDMLLPREVQQVASDAAMQAGVSDRALSLAQAGISGDAKDYRPHLWLGRMYWKAGKPDDLEKAKVAFGRARDLAETNPEVWVALVQFLSASGQADAARAEVESAEHKLTGPGSQLALAVCNETVGKSDRANELFGEALKAGPKDPAVLSGVADHCLRLGRFSDAQAHLRNLMAVSRESSPETFTSARRALAFLLALEGNPEKAQEALKLLDPDMGGKDAQGSATVLDRRARAQLLVMQNSKEKRRLAVQILEELIDQRLASADDYHLVAQIHDALGDWPKARKRFLDLRDLPGGDTPQFLATGARSLIRHGDVVEASVNFEKLKANPQSPLTHEIDARLRHSQGKTVEACDLLKEDAKSAGADLRGLAMLLAEFGDHDGAESMLRQFVAQSKQPDAPLVLIHFLIKRKKYGEALDLCDQFWDSSNNIAIAEACLQALDAAPADPQRVSRVETRLQASISKSPDRPELLVALATIRNFQGRYDEAVGLYRRVLEKNARHATALNNLAWILALQGGHGDEAMARAELAVEIAGQDPGVIDTRAVAALSLPNANGVERAIKDLETLTVENPTSTVYFHLSQAYVLAKREREARKAWQQALKLGLTEEQLHPLERPAYHQMQKKMN